MRCELWWVISKKYLKDLRMMLNVLGGVQIVVVYQYIRYIALFSTIAAAIVLLPIDLIYLYNYIYIFSYLYTGFYCLYTGVIYFYDF